ncbi:MAG TPA: type I-U CRISPR-associated helicase/endonuclease Cas3 [Pirellulaceae bacterium]|nr:type I-U CRISPR-associated helicase/endonuclease Cas3 [Pirellulaceae bacterium]
MTEPEFRLIFEGLTGNAPLCWQWRLFDKHFVKNHLCPVVDLPTGLGKTMVMAIWLIARGVNKELPRRLIYVVDRRTVVDQATDIAQLLVMRPITKWMHDHFDGQPPTISTLRGQLADNREWSRDPSRPAIIIGTVDLVGSALLFSGYRSSFKRRPLEAGLLGCDSLLVLDEAHLSKPFEKLLGSIDGFNRLPANSDLPIKPLRVIRMSATSANSAGSLPPFTLQLDAHGNLTDEDAKDETIVVRFGAKKRLTITTLDEKEKLPDQLAKVAIELAGNPAAIGKRIAVFVKKPEDAKAIASLIRTHTTETIDETGSKPRKTKRSPYADSVVVLTGTMRGLERDELVAKAVFRDRWLQGNLSPDDPANQSAIFLISTSAGEVGFDLNADHLAGDESPLYSWIQRLGRVNRRGMGDATVFLVRASKPADKTDFDKACTATTELFTDGMDVSPQTLVAFKKSLTPEEIDQASSPTPKTAELTDILLDAWSMTSITERMPGRPDVGPWLRGLDDEQAQTTIAWRAELELLGHEESPEKTLEAIFARHPIRPHESLTVKSRFLVDAFLKKIPKLKDRPSDLMTSRVAVRLPRGPIVSKTIEELVDNPGILFADTTLIFPATFGGLDTNSGMLDVESIPEVRNATDPEPESLDVADHPRYEQDDAARPRLRIVIRKSDGLWTTHPLAGGGPISDDIKALLQKPYETTTPLFTALKRVNLRVRLVQKIRFNDEGDAVEALVLLAPARKNGKSEDQSLNDHVAEVEKHARGIAKELDLPDSFREALLFAARWHDEGKKAPIWQTFANRPMPDGELKGKTSLARSPQTLKGYRHEFGSLLRLLHPDRCDKIDSTLPSEETARDLTLHLIATHHGSGRPHFRPAVYDPFTDDERDAIHAESIRRFARLQRKFGWWTLAWLENLLRCADQMASAADDAEDDPDGISGGGA